MRIVAIQVEVNGDEVIAMRSTVDSRYFVGSITFSGSGPSAEIHATSTDQLAEKVAYTCNPQGKTTSSQNHNILKSIFAWL